MCGIFGIKKSGNAECVDVAKAIGAIANRGPDGIGIKDFGPVLLAHTRLAVIDPLPEASQPFISDSGLIGLVFNGEIYNYKELIRDYDLNTKTTSDTEVVLCLYEKLGEECVKLLDGMFAFAIWDSCKNCLLLARDRAGEKPLYYAQTNNGFVFSSNIEAILASGVANFKLKKQSIWDFFSFLWVPEPNTVFENIYALQPGCVMSFYIHEDAVIYEYPNIFDSFDKNQDEIEKFIKKSVEKTVGDRLLSDVPIGAFLSGGIDSSIVCSIAAAQINGLPTFSVGFVDDVDLYSDYADETKYAVAVSNELGTNHTSIYVKADDFLDLFDDFVSYCDQPFAVVSGLGVLAVAKEAKKQGIKVLLSGDGADEIFGGYGWHVKVRHTDQNAFSPDKPKGWHYYATESQKHSFLSGEFFDTCESSTRLLIEEPLMAEPKKFLKHDMEFYLKNEMMTKLDRMTMAYGVEGRAAFVSPLLLYFADRVSYEDLLPYEETKYRLKQAFADVLPADVLSRPKHGFNPPIDCWMRKDWKKLLERSMSKESALYRFRIIDDHSVANFWDLFDDDKISGMICFCILVLDRWLARLEKKGYKICFTEQ